MNKTLRVWFCIALSLVIIGCNQNSQNNSVSYETQAYFSPQGHIREKIIKEVDKCSLTIDLAIFDFTAKDIMLAFERAKKRGVQIRIVADFRQAQGKYSLVRQLVEKGFKVKVSRGQGRGIMHNKFAVFDSKMLLTGSYNWTNNAENFNYENAILVSDPKIINQYQKEFSYLWDSAFVPVFK